MNIFLALLQGDSSALRNGFGHLVDLELSCSSVCPILFGQMEIQLMGEGSQAKWRNFQIQFNQTLVSEQMNESHCRRYRIKAISQTPA